MVSVLNWRVFQVDHAVAKHHVRLDHAVTQGLSARTRGELVYLKGLSPNFSKCARRKLLDKAQKTVGRVENQKVVSPGNRLEP